MDMEVQHRLTGSLPYIDSDIVPTWSKAFIQFPLDLTQKLPNTCHFLGCCLEQTRYMPLRHYESVTFH